LEVPERRAGIAASRQPQEPPRLLDEVVATAILDRLLHKAHVLNIKGRSYRLRDLEQSLSGQRHIADHRVI
jgi:DNA replication protein DnaC